MISDELRVKKIPITLDRYIHLLECEMELQSLECFGVDNWIGWGQAQQEYIQEYVDSHPLFAGHMGLTKEDLLDPIDLKTIAEYEGLMYLELLEEENAST